MGAVRRDQQKDRRAGHGGGAAEALGLLEAGRAGLAHHSQQAAGARAFFHRPEHVLRLVRVDKQETGGVEAEGGQPVAVKRAELAPGERGARPQDRTAGLRGRMQKPQQAEAKAERRRHVGVCVGGDLVQCAARQLPLGQGRVHLGQTEAPRRGRRLTGAFRRGFKRADLPAQLIE